MDRSKKKRFVRKKLDSANDNRFLIERIINVVQFATWNTKFTGDDILNKRFLFLVTFNFDYNICI
jgi:hypothetical protein